MTFEARKSPYNLYETMNDLKKINQNISYTNIRPKSH